MEGMGSVAGYKLVVLMVVGMFNEPIQSAAQQQFCGTELADALALVCKDTGYNFAIKPQGDGRGRRFKRGIVDECCRRGCSLKTLESYCSGVLSTKKDSLQISKRSELSNVQSKQPFKKKQDDKQVLEHFDKIRRNRRLRPLIQHYSAKYDVDRSSSDSNFNMEAIKRRDQTEFGRDTDHASHISLLSEDSLPVDTEEIMAEVVEPSPRLGRRKKRDYFAQLFNA